MCKSYWRMKIPTHNEFSQHPLFDFLTLGPQPSPRSLTSWAVYHRSPVTIHAKDKLEEESPPHHVDLKQFWLRRLDVQRWNLISPRFKKRLSCELPCYTRRNGVSDLFPFVPPELKTHVTNVHPCEPCFFLRNHLCSLAVAMQQFIHSACQQGTEGTMTHAVTLLATVMFNTWEGCSLACQEIWFPPVPNTRLSHFELRSNWFLLVLNLHLVGSILWRGQRTQQTLLSLGVCTFFSIPKFAVDYCEFKLVFLWSLDFFYRYLFVQFSLFYAIEPFFFCFETLTNLC